MLQDRSTHEGISVALENFQQSAGALQYLCDNFSNAPSTDMQSDTLNMLIQLMLVSYINSKCTHTTSPPTSNYDACCKEMQVVGQDFSYVSISLWPV